MNRAASPAGGGGTRPVAFTACTQESSKYWLPEGLSTRGLPSTPSAEIETLNSAESVASSLSETNPVGVVQCLCTASKMAVAYSSPLTAWLEVPSVYQKNLKKD